MVWELLWLSKMYSLRFYEVLQYIYIYKTGYFINLIIFVFIMIDVLVPSRTQEDFEAIETKHGNRTLRGRKYFLNIRHTINQVMCMCSTCKNQVTSCSLFLRHLVHHDFELQIVLIKRLDSFLFKYESVHC